MSTTGIRQTGGPDLRTLPCPSCSTVGSLTVKPRLAARPAGTWSLAGQQPKMTASYVLHIVCTTDGCGFTKAPLGAGA